jgi:hypothetical protein
MTELEAFGRALALEFSRAGNNLELIWTSGVLESAPALDGPWNEVSGAASPLTVVPGVGNQFYRLKK